MATVTLRNARKSFGDVHIIKGVDLDIADGEFCVFVGPSGCGKSTLLRMIAGLEDITSGSLQIGGREMGDVEPADRGVAMVFQSYALYPHMTVKDNIGFGLRMTGHDRADIEKRTQRAADMLQLGPLLDRKPSQLSGGQRQRVAIGRAIVREPDVFLFDEPLSNLDAALRVQMRIEIGKLHQDLGATMIYVTHDQVEAMTMADKIVVLNGGIVEQVGSPLELYHRPRNIFVAGFIGSPEDELHQGRGGSRQGRPDRAASARRSEAVAAGPWGNRDTEPGGHARHPARASQCRQQGGCHACRKGPRSPSISARKPCSMPALPTAATFRSRPADWPRPAPVPRWRSAFRLRPAISSMRRAMPSSMEI